MAVLGGCSTVSKKTSAPELSFPPPPSERIAISDTDWDEPAKTDVRLLKALAMNEVGSPMHTWLLYREAQLWSPVDKQKACDLWLRVSELKGFPLKDVARIRAVETCPKKRSEPTAILESLKENQPPAWLKEAAARAGLQRSRMTGDRKAEKSFAIAVAPFEKSQRDQLLLFERARALAKEQGDSTTDAQATTLAQKTAPRLIPEPRPEQWLLVAGDHRQAREFGKARKLYRKVLGQEKISNVDKLRALDGIRMTFKLEQEMDKFLHATREYADFARQRFAHFDAGPDLYRYYDAQIALARAIWTHQSGAVAKTVLVDLEQELASRMSAEESQFIRARIEEEAGHFDEALKILMSIGVRKIADINLKRKVVWYRAWNLRKAGRLQEAADALDEMTDDEDSPPLVARNRFWLARTLKDLGDLKTAQRELEKLIETDPLGYYGLIAHRELGRPLPRLLRNSNANPITARAFAGDQAPVIDWLLAVDEQALARKILDQLSAGFNSKTSQDETIAYLETYALAGGYQTLFGKLNDLRPEIRKSIVDRNPELLFPQPWNETVKAQAQRFRIKTELIYSIMRQESAFDPYTRSTADAFGLMQLLPDIAEQFPKAAKPAMKTPEDLYVPSINIAYGTALLRQLTEKWHGTFIPMVANYNANEKAVVSWLRSRDRQDPLQFIEDIPYEETRTYVKTVMRNIAFYSRLNSESETVPFPEWCLSGLQDVKP